MSLFGGDDFPDPPHLPEPPAPQELMDVIDEIAGAEAVTVTGADGKKRRVVRRLPRTKEEEVLFKKGQDLMGNALKNITQLYQYDPSLVVDFAPIIQTFADINTEQAQDLAKIGDFGNIEESIHAFKTMQKDLLDREYAKAQDAADESFIRRGYGRNSTGAAETRAALAGNYVQAQQKTEVDAQNYGEDLAAKRLNRNTGVFNLKEAGRQNRLNAARLEYELENKKKADLEQLRQNAINENQNQLQIGANLVGNDLNKALNNRANQDAINQMQVGNNAQMAHYNANVDRLVKQHQMDVQANQNKPQSFGDFALNFGGKALGWGLNNGAFGF